MQFTWVALYKIINRNWQKYKQGIMPQSQLVTQSVITLIKVSEGISVCSA